jgi:hypothetical protein
MQHFFTVLSWPKFIGLLVAAVALLCGWFKRKVCSAVWQAVTKATTHRFWSWVHQQIGAHTAKDEVQSKNRTYRGFFGGYRQHVNPPQGRYFIVTYKGITEKVPVLSTQMFEDCHEGDFVEIDTVADVSYGREAVQRVRTINRPAQ